MINIFFDIVNVRNLGEYQKKRNDNLPPYRVENDPRLEWLTNNFIHYFDDWKISVNDRNGDYSKIN